MTETQHILIDLDALLDTRLGILHQLNPAAAVAVMQESYYTRLSDDFETYSGGLVTNVEYRAAWANRDSSVIEHSRVTNMMILVESMFLTLASNLINTPFFHETKLTVNVWPYKLSAEAEDMLLSCAQSIAGDLAKVGLVSMTPAELTPSWIKQELSALIIYDWEPWLVAQDEALIKLPMPEVVLFIPAISYRGEPTKEECTYEGLGTVSPFALVEQSMQVFCSTQMISSGFFSIIRP